MDEKIIIMNDLKNILMHVHATADIFIFGVTFKLIHIPNQLPSLHQNTQQ